VTTSNALERVRQHFEWAQGQGGEAQSPNDLIQDLATIASDAGRVTVNCRSAIERLRDRSRSLDDPDLASELRVIYLIGALMR